MREGKYGVGFMPRVVAEINTQDGRWRFPLLSFLFNIGHAMLAVEAPVVHQEILYANPTPIRVETALIRDREVATENDVQAAYIKLCTRIEARAIDALLKRTTGKMIVGENGVLLFAGTEAFRNLRGLFDAKALAMSMDIVGILIYEIAFKKGGAYLVWSPAMNECAPRNTVLAADPAFLRFRFTDNAIIEVMPDIEGVSTESGLQIMRDVWLGEPDEVGNLFAV